MIIYYNFNDDESVIEFNKNFNTLIEMEAAYPPNTFTVRTKDEYDAYILKTKTLPALSADNVNHNYFNGSEVSLRKEQLRYQNSLFSVTLATIQNVTPAVPFVAHVRYLKTDDLEKYNNFNEFLKAQTTTDLERSNTYFEAKIAGDTDEEATKKAQTIVIDLSNVKAMNGKNEFLAWIVAEHPDDIRKYVSNVESLNYTTMLTEDEPE